MPLREEELSVRKGVQENHKTIAKEPVTKTKTMEVPITHEEVSIERRKPSGQRSETSSQQPISSKEEIEIPLKR